jgi:mannose-6-phosphate isomerase-like protein (cupin superfamily)
VEFEVRSLPDAPDVLAPDGSEVRVLAASARGSMAHFTLGPGECSIAVRHRTVEELWYVVEGAGEMWRRNDLDEHGEQDERFVDLHPGLSLAIPVGTAFQFRASAAATLRIVGVTMPPWPGDDEAVVVDGPWAPTVTP